VGGRRLDPTWFTSVTTSSPVWSRLDTAAQGKLVQIDLRAHGVSDFGKLVPRGFGVSGDAALELFVDGAPMTLARWPDASPSAPTSGFVNPLAPVTATSFAYT